MIKMEKKPDKEWDIGKEAKELDKLNVKERSKVEKSVIIKMVIAAAIFLTIIITVILVM